MGACPAQLLHVPVQADGVILQAGGRSPHPSRAGSGRGLGYGTPRPLSRLDSLSLSEDGTFPGHMNPVTWP